MRNVLLAMLAISAVFAIVSVTANPPMDTMQLEFAVNWTQRALGALIALAAGLCMLARVARNEPIQQLLPPALTALVGVLITASNWGVAVAIGAIVVGVVVSDRLGRQS